MVHIDKVDVNEAVVGGILISGAIFLSALFYGRMLNLSEMFNAMFKLTPYQDLFWKFTFFTGMVTGPLMVYYGVGHQLIIRGNTYPIFDSNDALSNNLGIIGWCISGLLVGIGERLTGACSQGHLFCSIPSYILSSRAFSRKTLLAVPLFLATAIGVNAYRQKQQITMFESKFAPLYTNFWFWISLFFFIVMMVMQLVITIYAYYQKQIKEVIITFATGIIYGFGILISGIIRPTKVLQSLSVTSNWNPQVLIAYGIVIALNILLFSVVLAHRSHPLYAQKLQPVISDRSGNTLLGALCFGVGWGISGMDIGPAAINFFVQNYACFWLLGCVAGHQLCEKFNFGLEPRDNSNDYRILV